MVNAHSDLIEHLIGYIPYTGFGNGKGGCNNSSAKYAGQ